MMTRFRLLEELGEQMSQSELARQSGVCFATINRMCTNATAQVSLATLDKLSTSLGVQPGGLITRSAPKRKRRHRRLSRG